MADEILSTPKQVANALLRPTKSADYRPTPLTSSLLGTITQGRPLFTYFYSEWMRTDPQIDFCLRVLKGPLCSVHWEIDTPSLWARRFIDEQLTAWWMEYSQGVFDSIYVYGYAPGEFICTEEKGRIVWDSYSEFYPPDATAMLYPDGHPKKNKLAGLRITPINETLVMPQGSWIAPEARYQKHYPTPRLRGAFDPFMEKNGKSGAIDSRRLWYKKFSMRGVIIKYPPGQTNIGSPDNPKVVTNDVLARQLAEWWEAGSSVPLPNIRDDKGDPLWEIVDPASFTDDAKISEYPGLCDEEISKGMGIPKEIYEASTSGSGYSGRVVPLTVYLSTLDHLVAKVLMTIARQQIEALLFANTGKKIPFTIKPKRLVDMFLFQQQQANGQTSATVGSQQPGQQGQAGQQPVTGNGQQPASVTSAGSQPMDAQKPPTPPAAGARGAGTKLSLDAVDPDLVKDFLLQTDPKIDGWQRQGDKWIRLSHDDAGNAVKSNAKGRWITIGGQEGADGKRHGGSPVFVVNGKIEKGAPGLTGKKISKVDGENRHKLTDTEESHRKHSVRTAGYEKASILKKARKQGINPVHVHRLAKDIINHDHHLASSRTKMLQHSRRQLESMGVSTKALHLHAARGTDATSVRRLDEVADSMASQYPEHFAGVDSQDRQERLFDMLLEGNPEPMSEQAAYEQALEHIASESQNHHSGGSDDHKHHTIVDGEVIPFSLDADSSKKKGDKKADAKGEPKGEHWVTIGGHEEGDEKHAGGFPVLLSGDGTILKGGPKGLHGKNVTDVHKHFKDERTAKKLDHSHPQTVNSKKDHAANVAAIPKGQVRHVAGYPVRHQDDGSFRAETNKFHKTGTPAEISDHIKQQWADQLPERGKVAKALERHAAYEEPNPFTDPDRTQADDDARRAVPHGARAVSLDPQTAGRVGSVVRNPETGGSHLALDNSPDAKANDFEPLDEQHSWRGKPVAKEPPAPKPKQSAIDMEGAGEPIQAKTGPDHEHVGYLPNGHTVRRHLKGDDAGLFKVHNANGKPVTNGYTSPAMAEEVHAANEASRLHHEGQAKSNRFEAGKNLTPEQKTEVLRSIKDRYKESGHQKDYMGTDANDREIWRYPHDPDRFIESGVTGAKLRHYITLPDGRHAHPTEVYPNIKKSDVERAIAEQDAKEAAERQFDKDRLTRTAKTKEDANHNYVKRNRKLPQSYLAQHEDGRIVRVDGSDEKDKAFFAAQGFKAITQPNSPDLKSHILEHLGKHGTVQLADLRDAMGHRQFDRQKPQDHPVHAALKELRDSGHVEAIEKERGEPSFRMAKGKPV